MKAIGDAVRLVETASDPHSAIYIKKRITKLEPDSCIVSILERFKVRPVVQCSDISLVLIVFVKQGFEFFFGLILLRAMRLFASSYPVQCRAILGRVGDT